MSLIMCDEDCKYQCEGYCQLEHTGEVKNSFTNGSMSCAYYDGTKKNQAE